MSDWAIPGVRNWLGAHAHQILRSGPAGVAEWRRHGIAPLVLDAVRAGALAMPTETATALAARCQAIARDNLRRTAELLRVAAAWRSVGVAMLVLKGPALAVLAYGDLARREFGDLDLLVARRDVDAAWRTLLDLGYRPCPPLTAAQRAIHRRSGYHQAFVNATTGVAVELHWALVPRALNAVLDGQGAADRARDVSLGGALVPTLGADDLLMFLAIHGAKHAWRRLAWIADFAHVMVRDSNVDWPTLVARAGRSGADRMLALAAALACGLTGAPPPPGVPPGFLAEPAVRWLAERVWQHELWAAVNADDPGNHAFQLAALPRALDRARYYAHWILEPAAVDFQRIDLPFWGRSLYYAYRPARLIRDRMRRT